MLTLDPTTFGEFDNFIAAADRAQAVLDALANPVTVRVYNGSGQVMGQGTMSSPWATRADGVLTVGALSAFQVLMSGSPDPGSWYLRFESGSRWLQGSFGLAASGADFRWSLPNWSAGQNGQIGAVDATAYDVPITFGWTFAQGEGEVYSLGVIVNPGGTVTIPSNIYAIPVGQTAHWSLVDQADGTTITPQTAAGEPAVITIGENVPPTSGYAFSVQLLDASATEVTTLGISNSGAWTFGQTFKQGDAPDYVAVADGQADVRNRWPDGSVKYAVLSGIYSGPDPVSIMTSATNSMSGQPVGEPDMTNTFVSFVGIGTATLNQAPASWDRAVAHRVRAIPGPVMSEFHYYAPCVGNDHLAVWWYVRAYSNGQVEVETVVENGWFGVAGPTRWDYRAQVTIKGSLVYDTVALINQRTPTGPSASQQTATRMSFADPYAKEFLPAGAKFYLNNDFSTLYEVLSNAYRYDGNQEWRDVTITSGTLPATISSVHMVGHYHHTRWRRVDWLTGSAVVPQHDTSYLQKTSLFPAYAPVTLAAAAYATPEGAGVSPMSYYTGFGAAYQSAPFMQHGITAGMGSGGDKESYGPVPAWAAAYLVSGDSRAFWCTVANSAATMRFSAHYRDEADGRPWRVTKNPTKSINDTFKGVSERTGSNPADLTIAPSGGTPATWAVTHSPAAAYAAYLLSGRWSDLEEQQFQLGYNVLATYALYNGRRSVPYWMQNRGQAWMFRDMAQHLVIAPTECGGSPVSAADALQVTDAQDLLAGTVDQWYDWYISGTSTDYPSWARDNAFGLPYQDTDVNFNDGSSVADGEYNFAGFMVAFQCMSVMYAFDIGLNATQETKDRLEALATFHAKFGTGLLGGDPNGSTWDWRLSSFVNMTFGYPGAIVSQGDSNDTKQFYRSSWDENWAYIQTCAAINWLPGTFPIPQDNYQRHASTNGTNYRLTIRRGTTTLDSTDTRAMWWAMHYAHKIADRVSVPGIDAVYPRLINSDTWSEVLVGRGTVRPDYALVSGRT